MAIELKLPYKWVKEYVKTDLSAEEFARAISLSGASIERWDYNETLDDNILEIEVTTNRVDSASIIGLAREASTILRAEFLYKAPDLNLAATKNLPLQVKIHNFERAPRFQSIVIANVAVAESPEWLKKRLEAAKINSINNIVDITNYVLLEYGQPMHAYDYDKLDGQEINVRLANSGETISTLGASEDTKLLASDLVIADASSPISVAGVKGGEKSGISFSTKNIVLEAGNFEPTNTRKTARKHNLITDASALFEKGLSPELTHPAMLRAIELVLELAGGEISSEIIDVKQGAYEPVIIKYPYSLTKRMLGVEIENSEIQEILTRLGFECSDKGDYLEVSVPYYRAKDVEFDYDLTEEIARIYGYQRIPSILPQSEIPVVKTPSIISNEDRVKDILSDNGFIETLSYSLVSDKHLELSEKNPINTIQMLNPLTEDYKYMRVDLASTMLMTSKSNETYKDKIKIFELSNVYLKTGEFELPLEESHLSILINGTNYKQIFYELKGVWELVLKSFGIDPNAVLYKNESVEEPFSKGKSAKIYFNNDLLGYIGVSSKRASKILGLKKENVILEVNFAKLNKIIDETIKSYKPIPKYPSVKRDLAFIIDGKIQWSEIRDLVKTNAGELLKSLDLFDMFEDSKLGENKKSIAFHLEFQSDEKTLEEVEVDQIISKINNLISTNYNAELRS